MAGAAYRAPLIAEKICALQGSVLSPICTINSTAIALGIVDAVSRGARVVNLSLGVGGLQTAINYALEHGVVVVAAAGNSNTLMATEPASYPGVISVAASDENNQRALWSPDTGGTCTDVSLPNYASSYGNWVDVYAPGKDLVYASFFTLANLNTSPYATKCTAGTSFAAPLVSGAASLVLGTNSALTPAQVKAIITETASNTGNVDVRGGNPIYLLNEFSAVQSSLSPPKRVTVYFTGTITSIDDPNLVLPSNSVVAGNHINGMFTYDPNIPNGENSVVGQYTQKARDVGIGLTVAGVGGPLLFVTSTLAQSNLYFLSTFSTASQSEVTVEGWQVLSPSGFLGSSPAGVAINITLGSQTGVPFLTSVALPANWENINLNDNQPSVGNCDIFGNGWFINFRVDSLKQQ